ncbi:MAG: sigma-70 family RNA polymerase sigma factor, partial [Chloroflexi bacterium]|nr:sigma-70 family RNA polymerase sigma factor [Chloroflexota bacterium]
ALALRSKDPLPEDALMQSDRSAYLQKLLQMLEPHYRLAVIYRYWYGYSYADIAAETGMTVSAVKSLLHRARRKLADLLEPSAITRLAAPTPRGT